MSKNIMWILIIGFVLGFISYEQISNNEWFFTFSTSTGNATFWEMISALGSFLIPVALAGWAWYSEHRKDKREQQKEKLEHDLQLLKNFLDTNMYPKLEEYSSNIKTLGHVYTFVIDMDKQFEKLKFLIEGHFYDKRLNDFISLCDPCFAYNNFYNDLSNEASIVVGDCVAYCIKHLYEAQRSHSQYKSSYVQLQEDIDCLHSSFRGIEFSSDTRKIKSYKIEEEEVIRRI